MSLKDGIVTNDHFRNRTKSIEPPIVLVENKSQMSLANVNRGIFGFAILSSSSNISALAQSIYTDFGTKHWVIICYPTSNFESLKNALVLELKSKYNTQYNKDKFIYCSCIDMVSLTNYCETFKKQKR